MYTILSMLLSKFIKLLKLLKFEFCKKIIKRYNPDSYPNKSIY